MDGVQRWAVLDSAKTQWNDYVGTAAADDADPVPGRATIYELADVDRDRWTIVGLDLTVDEAGYTVRVHAVDRRANHVERIADIEELGVRYGEVPVATFPVPKHRVEDIIANVFKRVSIRLVVPTLRDQVLVTQSASPRAAQAATG
jgi:hypothetical protein